jgi:hypothetical protein
MFVGGGVFGSNVLPEQVMEKRPECYDGRGLTTADTRETRIIEKEKIRL